MADFVHFIINEARKISTTLPISICRSIAKEAINKYPHSFGIIDENGKVIDCEGITLVTCLSNHNNYLNSKVKRKSVFTNVRQKHIKRVKSLSDGVPMFRGNNDEDEDHEDKRLFLKERANIMNLNKMESAKIDEFFTQTFNAQRKFLNNFQNIPTISAIINEWPHLSKKKYLKLHFDKLMQLDTILFIDTFRSCHEKLTELALSSAKFKKFNFQSENKDLVSIEIILKYFSEQTNGILIEFGVSKSIANK